MSTALREFDRRIVTQARELAGLYGIDAIRKHAAQAGKADTTAALTAVLGEAQYYIANLIRILEHQGETP